jgi:flagellar biosynthetic protein FliS
MNPHKAYQANSRGSRSRIDLLLELYDRAIDIAQRALAALNRGDAETARPLLNKAQAGWAALAAGVDTSQGEVAVNLARLYEFVVYSLSQGTPNDVKAALDVLTTLREALLGIRAQAVELERSGAIPPLEAQRLVEVTA